MNTITTKLQAPGVGLREQKCERETITLENIGDLLEHILQGGFDNPLKNVNYEKCLEVHKFIHRWTCSPLTTNFIFYFFRKHYIFVSLWLSKVFVQIPMQCLQFQNPYDLLMLYCVLNDYSEMAEYLWPLTQSPIACALIAYRLIFYFIIFRGPVNGMWIRF